MSKGVIFVGPPGTGKSALAKSIAGQFGKFMLTIEMAEWQGGIVGETEEKVRRAIEACIALRGNLVLFIDEIEKGLAGASSNRGSMTNTSDNVTQRAMAQFLKFLQDRPDGIFIIATCNSISGIDPTYLRAERWDGIFFVDLPNHKEQAAILNFYKNEFKWGDSIGGIEGDLTEKQMEGWSGAEIRTACRLAYIHDAPLNDVRKYVIPVSETMKEEIEILRHWKPRCIPASTMVVPSLDKKEEKLKRSLDI